LIIEKDDEINISNKTYNHLKNKLIDLKKNYAVKNESYNSIKNSNLEMKKIINFLLKQRNKK
jgi:antitoxin component of RelBE/YafQ-DinJ toxin-antitoxin module